jgi:hypothetical protein
MVPNRNIRSVRAGLTGCPGRVEIVPGPPQSPVAWPGFVKHPVLSRIWRPVGNTVLINVNPYAGAQLSIDVFPSHPVDNFSCGKIYTMWILIVKQGTANPYFVCHLNRISQPDHPFELARFCTGPWMTNLSEPLNVFD